MDNNAAVLIVDDEIQLCKLISRKLEKASFQTYTAYNGEDALARFKEQNIDIVILDYMLPDRTGLDVLKEMKRLQENIPVIMMTAYGNIESAVTAMKLGAADYLNKPMELEEIKNVVEKVYGKKGKASVKQEETASSLVFQSSEMNEMMAMLTQVKETDASILILGESGVGKTALAKWIHHQSRRKNQPFISINCAAIPETLLESELFGYQKGAFTGAASSKIGKFAAGDGGTVFLDEIGEISLSMQAKLLHVIEEKKVMQLGSNIYQAVDVRIITSTNKNVPQLVKEGTFRQDLYYRLNLVEVEVPPLRARKDDIPLLIDYQLKRLNSKYQKQIGIDDQAVETIKSYEWPGNIREMMNMLERVHILKREGIIEQSDLVHATQHFDRSAADKEETGGPPERSVFQGKLPKVLEEVEMQMIQQALEEANGNQTKAAEILGIARHTLIYKLKKMERKT
jgi:DNA-binding NtrC family response regulator